MRLCMFHPDGTPMERGWVGRIEGERVLHLAAQTLQSFFVGGGGAREHAEYRLADVTLLVPVLHPPTVRVFETQSEFSFANATAVSGPGTLIAAPAGEVSLLARVAAVVGAEEKIGGFVILAEWRAPMLPPPKDRDFGLVLGPVVVTPDELAVEAVEAVVRLEGTEVARRRAEAFDWVAALALAGAATRLRPGDVLAGPAIAAVERLSAGDVDVEIAGIGVLRQALDSEALTARSS